MSGRRRDVVLTPRARVDLDGIWAYSLAQWGQRRAEAYVRTIGHALSDLGEGLRGGSSASEVRPGYFRLLVGSHVVFYREPSAGTLEVVRILHQRMDVIRHA